MFERLEPRVGQPILTREVHQDRLWAVRPVHLLEAHSDLLLVHFSRGCTWLRPVKPDGAVHRLPDGPWELAPTRWKKDSLWFIPAGRPFAIHTMRIKPQDELRGWYINVQKRVQPTDDGFDYMDLTLDVVVAPDLSSWQLKDEDELHQGHAVGLYNQQDLVDIRAAAQEGIAFLRDHERRLVRLQQQHSVPRLPLSIPQRSFPDGMDVVRRC